MINEFLWNKSNLGKKIFRGILFLFVSVVCLFGIRIDVSAAENVWPRIYHKYGALFINTVTDAQDAYSHGLTLSLFEPHLATDSLMQTYNQLGMKYIDDYPWQQIQGTCGTTGGSGTCSLTEAQKQMILDKVQQHITANTGNAQVVGYMILDDYPGTYVGDLLQNIHSIIVQNNQIAVFPRFTQCDFGGRLDWRTSSSSSWQSNHTAFDRAVTNYVSSACDTIMLYFEGYNDPQYWGHPELIDWSMSDLLPYALSSFKSKGWDSTTQPLIASPQLYNWILSWWQQNVGTGSIWLILPDANSVAAQIKAYCQAGATTVLGYAWNDPSHDAGIKYELFNSPDLLSGYLQGVNWCIGNTWKTILATPTPSCPLESRGDADCNGVVNLLDFEIWRREFLGIDTTTKADFDSVGGVSILDFEIWRRGFLGI